MREKFTKRLVHDAKGRIVMQVVDSDFTSTLFDFASLSNRVRLSTIALKLCGSNVELSIPAAGLLRARPGGAALYWSLHSVYDFAKLKTYGGYSCKWISRTRGAWETALSEHGLAAADTLHHITYSSDDRGSKIPVGRESCPILPQSSASTFAYYTPLMRRS